MPERAPERSASGGAALPGGAKRDPILVADGLRRAFSGIRAVDVDHLEIARGAVTAIIGPNGAGKTTLFNLLSGFDRPDAGTWSLDGKRLNGLPAHRISRLGMVRTFQLTRVLARLTVLENVAVAAPGQSGERLDRALLRRRWRDQERQVRARARTLLQRFGIDHMADQPADALSGGQRKLLEMARALMTQPRLIMFDEPTAGVNPALTQSLLGHVRKLQAEGLTIVFIEHDMDVVMGISDWVVVMAQGRILAEGPPADIVAHAGVIEAYLGRAHGLEKGGATESEASRD
ncbi:MAG: ABC transporter ATP-binding protein [Chloroflexi bacterium]|nr:ABC transporter ATP-binding protein [Chloroflexota bacterium]